MIIFNLFVGEAAHEKAILCFAHTPDADPLFCHHSCPHLQDIQSDSGIPSSASSRRYAAAHVHGQYVTEDGHLSFSDGCKLTVVLRDDKLVLHTGTNRYAHGKQSETGSL